MKSFLKLVGLVSVILALTSILMIGCGSKKKPGSTQLPTAPQRPPTAGTGTYTPGPNTPQPQK